MSVLQGEGGPAPGGGVHGVNLVVTPARDSLGTWRRHFGRVLQCSFCQVIVQDIRRHNHSLYPLVGDCKKYFEVGPRAPAGTVQDLEPNRLTFRIFEPIKININMPELLDIPLKPYLIHS
jgi:hypothetical protein